MSAAWISYVLRDCPDGTSNTVAYAEALCGDNRGNSRGGQNPASTYRGNGVMGAIGNDVGFIYDVSQEPTRRPSPAISRAATRSGTPPAALSSTTAATAGGSASRVSPS